MNGVRSGSVQFTVSVLLRFKFFAAFDGRKLPEKASGRTFLIQRIPHLGRNYRQRHRTPRYPPQQPLVIDHHPPRKTHTHNPPQPTIALSKTQTMPLEYLSRLSPAAKKLAQDPIITRTEKARGVNENPSGSKPNDLIHGGLVRMERFLGG